MNGKVESLNLFTRALSGFQGPTLSNSVFLMFTTLLKIMRPNFSCLSGHLPRVHHPLTSDHYHHQELHPVMGQNWLGSLEGWTQAMPNLLWNYSLTIISVRKVRLYMRNGVSLSLLSCPMAPRGLVEWPWTGTTWMTLLHSTWHGSKPN